MYKSKLQNSQLFQWKHQSFFVMFISIKNWIMTSTHCMSLNTHTNSVQKDYKDFEVWNPHLQKKKYFQVIPTFSPKDNNVFWKPIINFFSSWRMDIQRGTDCLSSPSKEFTFPFCICLRIEITIRSVFKANETSEQDKKCTIWKLFKGPFKNT